VRDLVAAPPRNVLVGYAGAAVAVAVAGLAVWAISLLVLLPHVSAVFLFAVVASAIFWGLGPSLFAVVLSVVTSAYFIYPPIYSLQVHDPQDLLDLLIFSVLALVASLLANEVRRRGEEAQRSEAMMASLYTFSRRLAAIADPNQLLFAVLDRFATVLDRPVVLLIPSHGRLAAIASELRDRLLPDDVLAVAERLWREHTAEDSAPEDAAPGYRLVLLRSGGRNVGVLAIRDGAARSPDALASGYFNTLLDHAATAIGRAQFASAIEDARVEAKTEKLREALLNSISHDLKTPLASIIGSATALQSFDGLYDSAARADLAATIREEAERLHQFIGNVLDLTRIRAGEIRPRLEYVELSDIVESALRRTNRALAEHQVAVELPADLPMLRLDLFLTEHALVNVVENAAKYTPKGSCIRLAASLQGREIVLDVNDSGIGIASGELEPIFGQFYRSDAHDAKPAGTGLGLAICRAFIEANGGTVEALSPGLGHGATFRIRLPVPAQALHAAADRDE
jgi:two-component system sensor histidine kinase KdpD